MLGARQKRSHILNMNSVRLLTHDAFGPAVVEPAEALIFYDYAERPMLYPMYDTHWCKIKGIYNDAPDVTF